MIELDCPGCGKHFVLVPGDGAGYLPEHSIAVRDPRPGPIGLLPAAQSPRCEWSGRLP